MKVAVFPVPVNLVDRLFIGKRNVFVKYLPHPTSTSLKPNDKILFYASHASKQIVGEGTVQKVEFLNSGEAFARYGSKIFLSESELTEYTARQPSRNPSKKMLALYGQFLTHSYGRLDLLTLHK